MGGETDILFIHPPWKRGSGNVWRHVSSVTPPLGLASLAAVMEEKGVSARILDAQALELDEAAVVNAACESAPRWVGISATTPIVNGACRIARALRKRLPEARIVFGGAHPSALPEETLEASGADFVLSGEAEATLPLLVGGETPEKVPGLCRRDDGTIRRNEPGPPIEDLDALPAPAFAKLPIGKYRPALGNYRLLPCLGVTMTRGCYGRCTFCYRHIFGSKVRAHSAERILEILGLLRDRFHVREVQFYDDIFLGTKQRIAEFCELLLKQGPKMAWGCNLRAELTDETTLRLMRRAGCWLVDYGIESGDAEILGATRKQVDLERTIEAMRTARRAGMRLKSGLMLGFPGETKEAMKRTVLAAMRAAPDSAMFNIVTPFPGTEIFAQCETDGTLLSKDWDRYDYSTPLIALPGGGEKELTKIYRWAYRRFYFRPAVVGKWLRRARSREQLRMAADAFLGITSLVFLERKRPAMECDPH